MKLAIAASALALSACMSTDTPPRPEGVSMWDHVFGESSVPYAERNTWTKVREPAKQLPYIYVETLPCANERGMPKMGCAVINILANTCQPYIKASLRGTDLAGAKLHESAHCQGWDHADTVAAASSHGPVVRRISSWEY